MLINYDEEIEYCQKKFSRACFSLFNNIPDSDKRKLFLSARRIVHALREENPNSKITAFDVIDIILSAQYFARFGESPIETALKARHSK